MTYDEAIERLKKLKVQSDKDLDIGLTYMVEYYEMLTELTSQAFHIDKETIRKDVEGE